MQIKTKLYTTSLLIIVSLMMMGTFAEYSAFKSNQYEQFTESLFDLEIRLLTMRKYEKDFLLSYKERYFTKFVDEYDMFENNFNSVVRFLKQEELQDADIMREMKEYRIDFEALSHEILNLYKPEGLIEQIDIKMERLLSSASGNTALNMSRFYESAMKGEFKPSLVRGKVPTKFINQVKELSVVKKKIGINLDSGLKGKTRKSSHEVNAAFDSLEIGLEHLFKKTKARLQWSSRVVTIATGILVFLSLMQITATINLRMRYVVKTLKTITDSSAIYMRMKMKGDDEFVTISESFNGLLEKISELVNSAQHKSTELRGSSGKMQDELGMLMGLFNAQTAQTDSMNRAVHEMSSTIGEISESTSIAAKTVHESFKNARQGRDNVEVTVESIKALGEKIKEGQASIHELNQFIKQITDSVTLIQDIAEQTNLLALNAAIEAARAGEQGRGFAVVADEVRTLANRTHETTQEITNIVTNIESQMITVVKGMDDSTEQAASTNESSSALDQALSQIIKDMDQIQTNSERIAAAIEEQSSVMTEVKGTVDNFCNTVESNRKSAEGCLKEVGHVLGQAKDLETSVSALKTEESQS